MRDFIDSKCPAIKYVDIAKGCGLPIGFLYNLRHRGSVNHQMGIVLRFVCGLSRYLGESEEDLFVEYILGSCVGVGFVPDFFSMRGWLDHYRGVYSYSDVSERSGIDVRRFSVWFGSGCYPTDSVLRWLLGGLCQLTGGSKEEMCRSYFRMVVRRD